jgi:hypothetical protein
MRYTKYKKIRKRNTKKSKQKDKTKKRRKKSKQIKGGGFGTPYPGPFIGPPWNSSNTTGNYYSIGVPIGVGGLNPFYGEIASNNCVSGGPRH